MTKNSLLCGLGVSLLAGLGLWTLSLHAQFPEQPPLPVVPQVPIAPPFMLTPPAPQGVGPMVGKFTGKAIFVEAGDKIAVVLSNPEVKSLGGRTFITGIGVKDTWVVRNDFPITNATWIPVDTVKRIVEFKEIDDVKEPAKRAEVPEKKRADPLRN